MVTNSFTSAHGILLFDFVQLASGRSCIATVTREWSPISATLLESLQLSQVICRLVHVGEYERRCHVQLE